MLAHKFVSALLGMERGISVQGANPEERAAAATYIKDAEKFYFANVPLEPAGDAVAVPRCTDEEWSMWDAQLLPLPADVCWYEFDLMGERAGLVIDALPDGLQFRGMGIYKGCLDLYPVWAKMVYGDRMVHIAKATREVRVTPDLRETTAGLGCLLVYLTLMLHSRTTERRAEAAPVKLNKHRVAAGKPPLYSHTVVDIVPKRWVQAAHTATEGGSKRSPRLHWRRSHLRRFQHQTPNSQWVPALQCWAVAIPRFLVGKAELGEVTHEYRVRA